MLNLNINILQKDNNKYKHRHINAIFKLLVRVFDGNLLHRSPAINSSLPECAMGDGERRQKRERKKNTITEKADASSGFL